MKKAKFIFDRYELGLIVKALIEFRNSCINKNEGHDFVDEVILKLCKTRGV